MVVDTPHLGACTEDQSCVAGERSGARRSGVPLGLGKLDAGAISLLGDQPGFISLLTEHAGEKEGIGLKYFCKLPRHMED